MPSTNLNSRQWRFTLRQLTVVTAAIAFLAVVVGYFVRFKYPNPGLVRQRGREQAESDWSESRVVLPAGYQTVRHQNCEIRYFFDQVTGLELDRVFFGRPRDRDYFFDGYTARVRELLNEHGVPDWSREEHIVDGTTMVAMLNSDEMTEVDELPYEPSPRITLYRRGSSRHGGSSTVETLSIDTPYGFYGGGLENDPVYVGRSDKYRDIVFIRVADYMVFAFHKDGKMICSVDDDTALNTAFAAANNGGS